LFALCGFQISQTAFTHHLNRVVQRCHSLFNLFVLAALLSTFSLRPVHVRRFPIRQEVVQ
jgi:hypothetical protein